MSHECRALCQALYSSKRFSKCEDIKGFEEFRNLFFSTFNSKSNHSPKSSHLLFGNFVIFIVLKAGINSCLHMWTGGQVVSNMIGTLC